MPMNFGIEQLILSREIKEGKRVSSPCDWNM